MFTDQHRRGARWILEEALEVASGDSALTIHDELTQDVAACLRTVGGEDLQVAVDTLLVPAALQAQLSTREDQALPEALSRRIDDAREVIVLQARTPNVNAFRLNVLSYCAGHPERRTASMPGISLDHLHRCHGDMKGIARRCELLADLMLRARTAELITHALDSDDPLLLRIELGEHRPIISTGRITPGSWGNVPSGETFIVPNLHRAEGQVAIDGSLLGYPIPPGEELLLEFHHGRAIATPILNDRIARVAEKLLYDEDGWEVYENCTILSELGIGANEGIGGFTGLPLFDEKILGTVHLGLGRSTQFGGSTPCRVHNDFVIRTPTLKLGGVTVTSRGRFVLSAHDVYPSWRDYPAGDINGKSLFLLNGPHFGMDVVEGVPRAYVNWLPPRSRVPRHTRIGDADTSAITAQIIEVLRRHRRPVSAQEIADELAERCDPASIGPVLALMTAYGVARRVQNP